MSTKSDLIKNSKPVIRRITKGKTWSINITQSHIEKAKPKGFGLSLQLYRHKK